jgi:hypothetical protein
MVKDTTFDVSKSYSGYYDARKVVGGFLFPPPLSIREPCDGQGVDEAFAYTCRGR